MIVGNLLQNPQYKEKFVLQKLLCLFLGCTREELWTRVDRKLDDEMVQKIISAYDDYVVKKRPLEYILGYVEFFGTKFFVNEATLIPRPETEYMIMAVSEYIKSSTLKDTPSFEIKEEQQENKKNILMDIGTGCGVLGISVLLQNPGYFSGAIFTDYFADALAVAKKNYEHLVTGFHGIVEFLQSDLLEFLIHRTSEKSSALSGTSFEIKEDVNVVLVANLPYIPEETFDQNAAENVKNREPRPAFVGGADGLDYYRKMFHQLFELVSSSEYLVSRQTKNLRTHYSGLITMFLEMMTRQVDILRQEFGDRMAFEEVKTFHFNIRIVKARLK